MPNFTSLENFWISSSCSSFIKYMTGSGANSTFCTKASSTFLACSLHFSISDAYISDDEMTLRFLY